MTAKTIAKAIGEALFGIFFLATAYYIVDMRPIAATIFGIVGILTLIFGPVSVFLEKGEEDKKRKQIEKYKK